MSFWKTFWYGRTAQDAKDNDVNVDVTPPPLPIKKYTVDKLIKLLDNRANEILNKQQKKSSRAYGNCPHYPCEILLPKDYDNDSNFYKLDSERIFINMRSWHTDLTYFEMEINFNVNDILRFNVNVEEGTIKQIERHNVDFNIRKLIDLFELLEEIPLTFSANQLYDIKKSQFIAENWYVNSNGKYLYKKIEHYRNYDMFNFDDWSMIDGEDYYNNIMDYEWVLCENPKKVHWEHFLRLEISQKSKRASACIDFALSIFVKEQKYADIAFTQGGSYFARIEDHMTFNSFCKLVEETHDYEEYEIINALAVITQNNLLHPKK